MSFLFQLLVKFPNLAMFMKYPICTVFATLCMHLMNSCKCRFHCTSLHSRVLHSNSRDLMNTWRIQTVNWATMQLNVHPPSEKHGVVMFMQKSAKWMFSCRSAAYVYKHDFFNINPKLLPGTRCYRETSVLMTQRATSLWHFLFLVLMVASKAHINFALCCWLQKLDM